MLNAKHLIFYVLSIPSFVYALTPLQDHITLLSTSYIEMCVRMQILTVKNCKSEQFATVDDCFRALKPLFPKDQLSIYNSVEKNYEDTWRASTPRWIKEGEEGFKEYLDEYKGNNEKACIATATQYRTYKYLKWEEIKLLLNLNKK